MTEWTIMIY